MFFKKKKRMVDIHELQRKGIVRIPKKNTIIPTNRDGFIELSSKNRQTNNDKRTTNSEFFGFTNTTTNNQQLTTNDSSRLIDLDNKIYKLEQRIELLEKKLNVNKSTESHLGPMGW